MRHVFSLFIRAREGTSRLTANRLPIFSILFSGCRYQPSRAAELTTDATIPYRAGTAVGLIAAFRAALPHGLVFLIHLQVTFMIRILMPIADCAPRSKLSRNLIVLPSTFAPR